MPIPIAEASAPFVNFARQINPVVWFMPTSCRTALSRGWGQASLASGLEPQFSPETANHGSKGEHISGGFSHAACCHHCCHSTYTCRSAETSTCHGLPGFSECLCSVASQDIVCCFDIQEVSHGPLVWASTDLKYRPLFVNSLE